MPTSTRWIGGAAPQAQLAYVVPASVTIGNVFTLTINNKNVSFTATAATVANVTAGLAAAVLASTYPEFSTTEVVATDKTTYLLLTAGTPGKPFTCTAGAAVGTGTGTPTLTLSATLTTPVNSTFTPTHAAGSLTHSTTYYYRISAVNAVGETAASTETSQATLSGADDQQMALTWSRVPGATGYRVYGRTTGAEQYIAGVQGEATLTYTDTGAISPSGALPGSNTTATANQGPNCWGTAANWSANAIPANSDTITLDEPGAIKYDLDQHTVTPAVLNIAPGFRASGGSQIGLPQSNTDSTAYPEYRPYALRLGVAAVTVNTDAGLLRLDFGTTQTAVTVLNLGNSTETGVATLTMKGTNASNTLDVGAGAVAVAAFGGETATVATLTVTGRSANVTCSSGVTLTTVKCNAGSLAIASAVTTLTSNGGTVVVTGAGAITTADIWSGTLAHDGTGTISTLVVGSQGNVQFSPDVSRTVSACTVYGGGSLSFDSHTTTFSAGVSLVGTSLKQASIDAGLAVNLAFTGL